jgi:hypothetical protein
MKRMISVFVFVCMLVSVSSGGSSDIWNDGWITAGEYAGHATWTSDTQPLIVDGGGAISIEMRKYSQLEVQSTSTPLGLGGGIQYIGLLNNSHLNYYDGETFNIMLYGYATADLYGGRIDYLTSFQYATTTHVNIYALPGWSWISNDRMEGIQGQWWNGSPFRILFDNEEDFDITPVWTTVNVITPEPASLLLMTVGILLIRKR